MNQKRTSIIVAVVIVVLLIADQALKIWVKTNMLYGEQIEIFSWFKLLFIENNGAAFGMQISSDGFDWGKLLLSIFRIVMVGGLGYYIHTLIRKEVPMGIIIGLTLITAGALGNIIDSALYGVIFSESTATQLAQFGGSYIYDG